jgi:hypothetical protein
MDTKKNIDFSKKIEKKTAGYKFLKHRLEEFEEFNAMTAGGKGEQASAGLLCFIALHTISKSLALDLMSPYIDVEEAITLIEKAVVERKKLAILNSLGDEQEQERVLQSIIDTRDKNLHKK